MTTVDPFEVTVAEAVDDTDRFDVRLVRHAPGVLAAFNEAGVLAPADVHVALRLAGLATGADTPARATAATGGLAGAPHSSSTPEAGADPLTLAAALAVRAPRLGHVCVDLATIRHTVTVDVEDPVDLQALPWPDPAEWLDQLAASPLVAAGIDGPADRPLRLVGTLLYLDRYWREERQVAADLSARSADLADAVDMDALSHGLGRVFARPSDAGAGPDLQRLAGATAVLRRLAVVAGGPGTGKTTTVARILALLDEQAAAAAAPPPLVALAAPTGKAAARLEEAVHAEARSLDVSAETRARLLATSASTLHRLLGTLPRNRARFRHHRANRLPHDVVVVDETSMVPLSLMARLLEAVRPGARLVLVGDPEQLASVEAGAVLGDIVGPAAGGLLLSPAARRLLAGVAGAEAPGGVPGEQGASARNPAGTGTPGGVPPQPGVLQANAAGDPGAASGAIGDGVVVLRDVYRYGGAIAALAEAVRAGDPDAAIDVLTSDDEHVNWIPADVGDPAASPTGARAGAAAATNPAIARDLAPVRAAAVTAGRRVVDAARAGDARGALGALGDFRLLCAHRRGPYGVATWMTRVEAWLAAAIDGYGTEGSWYAGRPLLVTENDYALRLYNGDTGVVVATAPDRLAAVFERRGDLLEFSPTRLGAVDTVHAMTIHKSQGSQFDTVAVLLPDPDSPILTRELLYTAATRARRRLLLVATEPTVRAAVTRPIARASGLRRWLWGQA